MVEVAFNRLALVIVEREMMGVRIKFKKYAIIKQY